MGDMICTTPLFRAIKKKYPDSKITVVGNAVNKIVLGQNPDVDSYIVYEENKYFDVIKKLRAEKAEFGCITAPSPLILAILYLAGIPFITTPVIKNGWSPFETKTYKIMCNFVVKTEYIMGQYMPKEFLKLLEPIDIFTDDTKKYVFWSKPVDAKMRKFISGIDKKYSLYVGIMPGAGNKIKQWPAERFASVADYLALKHNAHIFIIGNESNRSEINTMLSCMENRESATDCSWTSLEELKALISMLHMTVSVDTGPVFIAEACGVSTIDIGGVINPHDMAPNDGKFHILISYEGEPLLWSMNSRVYDYEKARKGIESITVATVIEKIEELLAKIGKG